MYTVCAIANINRLSGHLCLIITSYLAHVHLDDVQAPITGQQIVESTEEEAPVQDKVEDVVDVQKTEQDCQVVEQADVASQVPS